MIPAVQVIQDAHDLHGPFVRTVCLFSGGGDSGVLAHAMRDHYDELLFVDTSTALPGVREHVESFAAWLGKPLTIRGDPEAFRRMVLGGEGKQPFGFPGPGQHHRAYQRLKERQMREHLKAAKEGHSRMSRVLFLSGVRRAESQRRAAREAVTKERASVYCNPLIDWSDEAMRDYRREHRLPVSDVAALLHRSGECNCGAFAAPGEREEIRSLWPTWFAENIEQLEIDAIDAGIPFPRCLWGWRADEQKTAELEEKYRSEERGKTAAALSMAPLVEELDDSPMCSSCAWKAEA